jgi:predicted dehydrogenase
MITCTVVGFGRMGKIHFKAAQDLGISVTSIIDPNLNASNDIDSKTLIMKSIHDCPATDLFIVSTTTNVRIGLLEQIFEKKPKYILLEKPIGSSVQSIKMLLKKNRSNKINFAVNHQMRYFLHGDYLKQVLQDKRFGELVDINLIGSNFGLAMNGSHFIEFFKWLLDEEIVSVSSKLGFQKSLNPRGSQFKDYCGELRAVTYSNLPIYISFPESAGHGILTIYNFNFAKIIVDELTGSIQVKTRSSADFDLPTTRYGLKSSQLNYEFPIPSLEALSRDLIRNLINEGPVPSLEDGVYTLKVIFSAILSSKNSQAWTKVSQWDTESEEQFFA